MSLSGLYSPQSTKSKHLACYVDGTEGSHADLGVKLVVSLDPPHQELTNIEQIKAKFYLFII